MLNKYNSTKQQLILMDRYRIGLIWERILYAILICLFLTPSFPVTTGLSVRIEDGIVFCVIGYLGICFLLGHPVKVAWGLQQNLLIIFLFFIIVSIITGTILGLESSLGDLNQFTKIMKYVVVYTAALTTIQYSRNPVQKRHRILHFIMVLSIILSVIVFQQYFNWFSLNSRYVEFIAPTQFITLTGVYSWPRPVGMVGNPNELAFLFVISALITFWFLFCERYRFIYIVALAIQLSSLFVTLSRSGAVSLAIAIATLIILTLPRHDLISALRIIFVTCAIVGIVAYLLNTDTIYNVITWRFVQLSNLETARSWQLRLDNWNENLDYFWQSPVLGVGPLRYVKFEYAADNEWLLLLRSYGIIGTSYLLFCFVLPQLRKLSILSNNKGGDYKILAICLLVAVGIYMIPSAVFHSLVLMPVALSVLSINDASGTI